MFAFLYFPGTFIHEASHFLAALFLLVPVGKLEIVPAFKEEGGVNLGSVSIAKTDPFRRFIIGIAPLIFGITLIFAILYVVTVMQISDAWWKYSLAGVLIFEIANSMFASKKDLEGSLILLIFVLIVVAIFIISGIDISINLNNSFLSGEIKMILKNACLFLLLPILIDIFALFILKRFSRRSSTN